MTTDTLHTKRSGWLLALGVWALCMAMPGTVLAQSASTRQLLEEADKNYERGEWKKAAANYDRAISAEPSGVKPEVYAKRATLFVVQNDFQSGLNWIENTAEKVYPGNPLVSEQKAVLLSRLPGRKKDAVDLAERTVQVLPRSYVLHSIIAEFYYRAGASQADKTINSYSVYLDSRPDDLSAMDKLIRVKLGIIYLHKGSYDRAEEQFNLALRARGDERLDPNARKGLCATYVGQQKWDKALTVCEQVLKDRRALRGDSSVYFNMATAYLERRRYDQALAMANTYIRMKPAKAQGYLLRGRVYYGQEQWNEAEGQFTSAERIAPRNPEVAKWLGKLYLNQPRPQPEKAVEKLQSAFAANPDSPEIVAELAWAYYSSGKPQEAATIAGKGLEIQGQSDNPRLHGIKAQAHYTAGELPRALEHYKRVTAMRKNDREARSGVVNTLNRMAAVPFQAGNLAEAERILTEALRHDNRALSTNFNLGLVFIERDEFAKAVERLRVRQKRTPNDLLTNRLLAKAYLNAGDDKAAAQHYAQAEEEARRLRNFPILAEIYTEWAPLVLGSDLDRGVDMLEQAVQYSAGQPFARAAKRNLQVAYFQRGYDRLKNGNEQAAISDMEGATREPALLVGAEEDVFSFALGLAYLGAGQGQKARTTFLAVQRKSGKGQEDWLQSPYDQVGIELMLAYANYREGSSKSRVAAAGDFAKLLKRVPPRLKKNLEDLIRSSYEYAAYEDYQRGDDSGAARWLERADKYASGNRSRIIDHNIAVIELKRRKGNPRATFEKLGSTPPEALVNLGILYDRAGESRRAFEAWQQAKLRNARARELDQWIASKRRIYGY